MKTNRPIKCLIWDLDNTIWQGTLAENGSCRLKSGVVSILDTLDHRGILMSIASANDDRPAMARLKTLGIAHYFISPRINWDHKPRNIRAIAGHLGITMDTIGFIDDEPYELAQVEALLPHVRTYAAEDYVNIPRFPEFNPRHITEESSRRREMYIQGEKRAIAEKRFRQNRSDFLRWTQTSLSFNIACDEDYERIAELMNRTTQLNATGEVYPASRVRRFLSDPEYRVYIARLKDRFVDYGKIGVAVCHRQDDRWRLISFLVSCRVLSRGISAVFLNLVRHEAYKEGIRNFEACYRARERNRKMLMLYTLGGLKYLREENDHVSIYAGACCEKPATPAWLSIERGMEP